MNQRGALKTCRPRLWRHLPRTSRVGTMFALCHSCRGMCQLAVGRSCNGGAAARGGRGRRIFLYFPNRLSSSLSLALFTRPLG